MASRKHSPPPESVRVGCFDYRIVAETAEWARSASAMGDIDNALLVIHYAPQPPQQEINTIIHEVFHAACYASRMMEMVKSAQSRGEAEEQFVTSAANVWHQILRDNPKLVAYITQ